MHQWIMIRSALPFCCYSIPVAHHAPWCFPRCHPYCFIRISPRPSSSLPQIAMTYLLEQCFERFNDKKSRSRDNAAHTNSCTQFEKRPILDWGEQKRKKTHPIFSKLCHVGIFVFCPFVAFLFFLCFSPVHHMSVTRHMSCGLPRSSRCGRHLSSSFHLPGTVCWSKSLSICSLFFGKSVKSLIMWKYESQEEDTKQKKWVSGERAASSGADWNAAD
jgi:hypothetical protein